MGGAYTTRSTPSTPTFQKPPHACMLHVTYPSSQGTTALCPWLLRAAVACPVAWGTVHPRADNGADGFVVAHGVTTLVLERKSNWVQVANTSTKAILIRRGLPVADFHRQHLDAFDVVEVDLDASATSAAQSVAAAAVQ